MGGECKFLEAGIVTPSFTASTPFNLEFTPESGILETIRFELRGSRTVGAAPTVLTDGELNFIGIVSVMIPRKNRAPYFSQFFLKDLKWINAHLTGQVPRPTAPSAAGANVGELEMLVSLGRKHPQADFLWGIDTEEISGPIKISGSWGVATDYGADQTMTRQELRVYYCVSQKKIGRGFPSPKMALVYQANRIALESETRSLNNRISASNAEGLYGLLVRTDDASAAANARRDGLLTRFELKHSELGRVVNGLYIALKRQGMAYSKIDLAEEGIAWLPFNHEGNAEGMLDISGGKSVSVDLDSVEAAPDGVTNVVNAAGDAVFVTTVGAQLSETLAAAVGA